MSAPDGSSPHYAAAMAEDWASDWVLGPRYVVCRHCQARQSFDSAARADTFTWHKDKCPSLMRGGLYPLQELSTALKHICPVPA